jgi:hypothetical protein
MALAECKQSSLDELMKAFRESLSEQTAQYVLHTTSRLRKIVEGCSFQTLADIDAEAVVKFMWSLRKTEKIAPRTYNNYLQAIDAFCNWCVATKRVAGTRISPNFCEAGRRCRRRKSSRVIPTRLEVESGAESGAIQAGFATLTPADQARIVAGLDKLPDGMKRLVLDAAWAALSDRTKADIALPVGEPTMRKS